MEFEVALPPEVPAGVGYTLKIVGIVPHMFGTGRIGVRIEYEIVSAPALVAADHNELAGAVVSESYVTDGPGAALLRPVLVACGIEVSALNVSFKTEDLLGRDIAADLVEELYQGEPRVRVRKPRAPGSDKSTRAKGGRRGDAG